MGEDYELLAALPQGDPLAGRFHVVGRVEEGDGVVLLRRGEAIDLAGWDHFGAGSWT
jgi:thiamine monophosphate kinase